MSSDKSNHRTEKVEKELRDIIAGYILRYFPSSMIGVNQVNVNKDLRGARVYIGVLGGQLISDEKLEEVQGRAFDIQKEISAKLHMRYCPKLRFYKDEGLMKAAYVDEVLSKIKKD